MLDLQTSRRLMPALLLALAGCSMQPVPAKPPHRATHLLSRPHPAKSRIPTDPAAGSTVPVQREPLPEIAAHPSNAVPMNVLGLSQSDVRQLLGPPTTSSTKGAAQAWTYQLADCSVEIGFYYDVTRTGFFALSERLARGRDEQNCLSNIHDNHAS
jgi:hypothetical protein